MEAGVSASAAPCRQKENMESSGGVSVSEASQRAALFTSYLADVESRLQSHCILDKISEKPHFQPSTVVDGLATHLDLLDAWV